MTEEYLREAARILASLHFDAGLPWRTHRTPYRVFLAEFLLVHTRWDVVAARFEEVFRRYPDLISLAEADPVELAEVLKPFGLTAWRPRALKEAAAYLVEHHGGNVPETVEELGEIPGLGPYLSAAIAAFAYHAEIVPPDRNVFRFLAWFTGLPRGKNRKGTSELRRLLPLLSPEQGGPPAAVLIDFLRLICLPRRPRHEACPLRHLCRQETSL